MHFFPFNIPDWALHTAHLDPVEESVYLRLLMFCYDTEGGIPKETGSVIRRLRLRGYEETVEAILDEFFTLEGDTWRSKRVDEEVQAYQGRVATARENGKKGGRPNKRKGSPGAAEPAKPKPTPNPTETGSVISGNPEETNSKANQEPRTKNQEPIPPNPPGGATADGGGVVGEGVDELFAEFWSEYPRKDAKVAARKAWASHKPDRAFTDRVIEDVRRRVAAGAWRPATERGLIPHPATYLNGARWNDEIIPRAPGGETHPPGSTRARSITDDLTDTAWAGA